MTLHTPPAEYCCEQVRDQERWPRYHRCRFKAAVTREGKPYCRVHDPKLREIKVKERQRDWNTKQNQERFKWHGRTFYNALKQIAEGHNDPGALARETIAEFHKGEAKIDD